MRVYRRLILLPLLLSLGFAASVRAAGEGSKNVIVKVGEPHFEARLPVGVPLRLYVRSGDIHVVGSEDSKITVDVAGKNAERRIASGWTPRSVIGSDVAIGNDYSLTLLIFREFPEQRIALFWIEIDCCFRKVQGFLVIGKSSE